MQSKRPVKMQDFAYLLLSSYLNHALFVKVFAGHVVFGHFTGAYFPDTAFSSVLDARDYSRLERVPLLDQLVNAFRICALDVGQTLQISRLRARTRSR